MRLNDFGKLAVGIIIAYIPLALVAFFVTIRHGFSRKTGWLLLVLYSIVRIVGAALTIISQQQTPPSTGLITAVGIVSGLGLSPLLVAAVTFVSSVVALARPGLKMLMHGVSFVITGGVILGIIGGIKLAPGKDADTQQKGHKFSKMASVSFLLAFIALVVIHVLVRGSLRSVSENFRRFFKTISIALPFLAVRLLYSMLGAFVPSPSKWSPINGDWKLFLAMGIIMEYISACIYIFSGFQFDFSDDGRALGENVSYSYTNQDSQDNLLYLKQRSGNTGYGYA